MVRMEHILTSDMPYFSCMYFNPLTGSFSSDGCKIDGEVTVMSTFPTKTSKVTCCCSHLTSFAVTGSSSNTPSVITPGQVTKRVRKVVIVYDSVLKWCTTLSLAVLTILLTLFI